MRRLRRDPADAHSQLRAIIQHHAPHALPPRLAFTPTPAPSYAPATRSYAPPVLSGSFAPAPAPIAPRRATLPPPSPQTYAPRFASSGSFAPSDRSGFDASHRYDPLSRPLTTASGLQLGSQPPSWLARALPPSSTSPTEYAPSPTLPPLTDGRRYEARAQPLPSYSSLPTTQYGWQATPIAPPSLMPPDGSDRWAFRPPPPSEGADYRFAPSNVRGAPPY